MTTRTDVTNAVSTALTAAAVVLQAVLVVVLVVAAASLWSPRARRLVAEMRDSLLGGELWAAWGVALVATAGSLFYSEYAKFIPCRLCWFQRIGMYPLVAILLIAAIRKDVRGGALYALPLPILGSLVATYHIYIEYHPEAETAGCMIGAPCSTK